MRLVKFYTPMGQTIYINPEHVASMVPYVIRTGETGTRIFFQNGGDTDVTDRVDTVALRLCYGPDIPSTVNPEVKR